MVGGRRKPLLCAAIDRDQFLFVEAHKLRYADSKPFSLSILGDYELVRLVVYYSGVLC